MSTSDDCDCGGRGCQECDWDAPLAAEPHSASPCAGCGVITSDTEQWKPRSVEEGQRPPGLDDWKFYCARCLGLKPADQDSTPAPPVPDSRPVDLAGVIAYHRRKAPDPWHVEAAEALEFAELTLASAMEQGAECERERIEARSKLDEQEEELRLLRAIHEAALDPSSGPPYWADVLDAYRAWKEGK